MFEKMSKKVIGLLNGDKKMLIIGGLVAFLVLIVGFILLDAIFGAIDEIYYDMKLYYIFSFLGLMLVAAIFYNMKKATGSHITLKMPMYIIAVVGAYFATIFINPSYLGSGDLEWVGIPFWWLVRVSLIAGFMIGIHFTKAFVPAFSYFTVHFGVRALLSGIFNWETWMIVFIAIAIGVYFACIKFAKSEMGFQVVLAFFVANLIYTFMYITEFHYDIELDHYIKYAIYLIIAGGLTFYITHATAYLDKIKAAFLLDEA